MIRAAKTIFSQVLPTLMRLTPCITRKKDLVSSLLDVAHSTCQLTSARRFQT